VVKATAAGSSQVPPTALALTVDHRDALRWWPAIAIAAGLLGSVLLTVFVNRLAASIRGNRLDQLLVQNRHATPRNRIVGLEQWVATRRELGDSDETLLAVVAPLTKNGPKKAREQRRQLRLALEQSSLPNDHPLAVSARAEVGRETHQVSDFVDESGNPQVHPADRLRAAIGMMDAFADQLQRLESEITNGLTKRCQEEPMRSLEQAKTWWQHQSSPDSFDRLAAALGDAEAALYAKLNEPGCAQPEAKAAAAVREDLRAVEPAASAAMPLALGSAPAVNLFGLGALTLLSILVALGFAAVTVYIATYDTNATFGTWEDYFKLVSAALAAGAAGTIAGFLAPWGASAPAADGAAALEQSRATAALQGSQRGAFWT
jgi:hypothetical protein